MIFAITPDGHIAEYLRGVTFPGLADAMRRAQLNQTTHSIAHDLIACFHFDPSLQKYGRAIQLFWRLGAAVVLASLIALIGALVIWERKRRRGV